MPNLNLPQWAGIAAFVSMTAVTYAEGPIMRDAATHEQLAQAQRQAGQSEPKKILTVPKGEEPSVVNRPQDLLSQSDILCLNGMATLVPKRAILYQHPRGFRCRHCCQLDYKSHRERSYDRMLRRSRRLRARVGGGVNLTETFPARPKGMHWATYERLLRSEAAIWGEISSAAPDRLRSRGLSRDR